MVDNANVGLLSEMLELQKEMLNLEESMLHTKIFDQNGDFSHMVKSSTEYEFFQAVAKELEDGNSFGIIYLDDVNIDDSLKNIYCSKAAMNKIQKFITVEESHNQQIAKGYNIDLKHLLMGNSEMHCTMR